MVKQLKQHFKEHAWLHLAGFVSAVAYGSLAFESREIEPVSLSFFYTCWLVAWAALVLFFVRLRRGSVSFSLIGILVWAAIFRVMGIIAIPMLAEDDYFRFLWDGYRFAETGSPYQEIPADFFDKSDLPESMSEIVYDINHPHLPTIYGPVAELVFLLSYKIAPGSLIVLKIFFVLFEALLLFLLSRLMSMRWLAFIAWCPLLVIENSFQAHPEMIGVAFMVWAVLAGKNGRPWMAMMFLGVATSAKVFAVLLWPFIVEKARWFRQGVMLAGVIVLIYLPFLLQREDAGSISLQAMATEWEFNSAGYALLRELSETHARLLSLIIYAVAYVALVISYWWRKRNDPAHQPRLDVVFGLFFFLSPVINPWYLLWLLPFSILTPRWWSLTAVFAVTLSYITGLNLNSAHLEDFAIPLNVKLLEFGIILGALLFDTWIKRKRRENAVG